MLDLTDLDDAYLRALCKALHQARFCHDENDPTIWASPLVVDLHVWALDEQRQRDEAAGRETNWDAWLAWAGRDETQTVVRRLQANHELLRMVTDDPDLLRRLLRPFHVEDDDLVAMLNAARPEG